MPIANVSCSLCALDDPQARTQHHFDILERGLESFRDHLEDAYKNHPNGTRNIPMTMEWATGIITNYSGMADPQTGAPLPWRRAMRHFHAYYTARYASTPHGRAPDSRSMDSIGHVMRALLPLQGTSNAWAKCWIWLFEQGFARPGRERFLAAECRYLADAFPGDREDWLRHARRLEEKAR